MQHNGIEAVITDGCPFSKRKKLTRVFGLRALGLSQQEIAEKLHREITTINSQCCDALAEMEAHTVQEAVAKAVAEGWLTFRHVTKNLAAVAFLVGVSAHMMDDSAIRHGRVYRSSARSIRIEAAY